MGTCVKILGTCQGLPVSKLTPCGLGEQRPLHLFHQNTYHQKSLEKVLPMMTTTRRLIAFVAVWVLYECVTQ
jgi:hypothetical protein